MASKALKVSYSDVNEGGVAVNCEKTQFFLNTLYFSLCALRATRREIESGKVGERIPWSYQG